MTPELVSDLDGVAVVVFLDAAQDLAPGTAVVKRISAENQMVWTHDLSPGQLTGLTELLTDAERPVFQITGGIHQSGFGERLTPGAEQSAQRMTTAAIELLREYAPILAKRDCSAGSV